MILFIALMGYLVYFTTVKAKTFVNSPYNQRQDSLHKALSEEILQIEMAMYLQQRKWTKTEQRQERIRTARCSPMLSDIMIHSLEKPGLESAQNFDLLTSNAFFMEKIQNEFKEKKIRETQLLQHLMQNFSRLPMMRSERTKSGYCDGGRHRKILTLVSKPDFDPNTLAENWEILNTDEENSPLLNRATNGSYAPGSVFKIVTALAYMRQDTDYNSYSYDCQGSITEDNVTIRCFNGTVHGYEDLRSSFANSCNASFANIGLSLDVDGYRETAESLLSIRNSKRYGLYKKFLRA